MKQTKYIILLVIGLLSFSACTDTLTEINTDPSRLTEVDLRLMLPEAIAQSFFNEGGNQARVAGLIMKQFEGLDAQQIDYGNYNIAANAMDNYWNFGLYAGSLRACQAIIEKSEEVGSSSFYAGVAKILMANQYGIATSMFGDIPMTEALRGIEFLQPSYDSQESVYAGVQSMLDEGIADLASAEGYAGGDLVFGGDAANWIATAHAFKARYYLQVSKRSATGMSDALASIGNAFADASAQPNLTFDDSQIGNHALAKFGTERPGTLGFHPDFAAMLTDDPRGSSYFLPDTVESMISYQYWGFDNLVWAQNNATLPLISYVELKMMEAEITAANGGDASAMLEEAILASMAMVGVEDGGYAAANSSLSGMSSDEAIEKIMTEAYKAYYGFNFHGTWSNYRRTGYPAITPQNNEANGLNPGGQVPRRFLYADSESATNSANLEAAQAAQSGALLNIDVWAFE